MWGGAYFSIAQLHIIVFDDPVILTFNSFLFPPHFFFFSFLPTFFLHRLLPSVTSAIITVVLLLRQF